jgi:glycosyltransferase involved in cell wall biosynthesis
LNLHILTGEYPPVPGGVADYTAVLAGKLAEAGCNITIWTGGSAADEHHNNNITVHRSCGRFTIADLRRLSRELDAQPRPRVLLVQYVPYMYGWRSMNLPFAAWLYSRRHRDDVRVMFHEVAYPFVRKPLHHNLLAVTHRIMAGLIAAAARKIYVSTPAWLPCLRQLGARQAVWLPIPSTVLSTDDRINPQGNRIGHFGSFGPLIANILRPILAEILHADSDLQLLLIGGGSAEFRRRWIEADAAMAGRIQATDRLPSADAVTAIRSCSLMVQPYPDGANTRRTSLMACLAAGAPTITNIGANTEPILSDSIAMARIEDMPQAILRILDDATQLREIAECGKNAYRKYFDWPNTIRGLLEP